MTESLGREAYDDILAQYKRGAGESDGDLGRVTCALPANDHELQVLAF